MKKQQCINVFRYLHALCLRHSHDVQEFSALPECLFVFHPACWVSVCKILSQCQSLLPPHVWSSLSSANLHFKFQPYPKHIWLFGITRRDRFPCFQYKSFILVRNCRGPHLLGSFYPSWSSSRFSFSFGWGQSGLLPPVVSATWIAPHRQSSGS